MVIITCVSFSFSVIAMEQNLEVCIRFKKSSAISVNQVDANVQERCKKFGMLQQSTSEDIFFPVVSAISEDFLDSTGYVQFEKDLIKNIPYVIQRDLLKEFNRKKQYKYKQISALEKEYRFPTFVPQSFIEQIENSQRNGQRIVHELYKNNDHILKVCYTIKSLQEKTHKEPSVSLTKRVPRRNHSIDFHGISELGFYAFVLLFVSNKSLLRFLI